MHQLAASGGARVRAKVLRMRIIHTADWHFGASFERWPEELAPRRRAERERAVLQIIAYAKEHRADYLLVSGDVCDFPEQMPKSVLDALEELKGARCVPVLFFTNGGHDANRAWWQGAALGPMRGEPTHPAVRGRGHRLPHSIGFDDVAFAACDHVPEPQDLKWLSRSPTARILLLHAQEGVHRARLETLREHCDYVACGDCHAADAIVPGWAHYSGSPSFRDLSSIDPGPRSFLDVSVTRGGMAAVETIELETPLAAVVTITPGAAIVKPQLGAASHAGVAAALAQLPRAYAYAKVQVDPGQRGRFEADMAAASAAGWVHIPWTETSDLFIRQAG